MLTRRAFARLAAATRTPCEGWLPRPSPVHAVIALRDTRCFYGEPSQGWSPPCGPLAKAGGTTHRRASRDRPLRRQPLTRRALERLVAATLRGGDILTLGCISILGRSTRLSTPRRQDAAAQSKTHSALAPLRPCVRVHFNFRAWLPQVGLGSGCSDFDRSTPDSPPV